MESGHVGPVSDTAVGRRFRLERDGQPTLVFRGEEVAAAWALHHAQFNAGTKEEYWTESKLYRTSAGTLVAFLEKNTNSHRHDAKGYRKGKVCRDADEVLAFLGDNDNTAQLLKAAGL